MAFVLAKNWEGDPCDNITHVWERFRMQQNLIGSDSNRNEASFGGTNGMGIYEQVFFFYREKKIIGKTFVYIKQLYFLKIQKYVKKKPQLYKSKKLADK